MIQKRPIDSAPKDGTQVFAWDGEWWRRARWTTAIGSRDGAEQWVASGFLPIKPTHWYPADDENYEMLLELVAAGNRRDTPSNREAARRLIDAMMAE